MPNLIDIAKPLYEQGEIFFDKNMKTFFSARALTKLCHYFKHKELLVPFTLACLNETLAFRFIKQLEEEKRIGNTTTTED